MVTKFLFDGTSTTLRKVNVMMLYVKYYQHPTVGSGEEVLHISRPSDLVNDQNDLILTTLRQVNFAMLNVMFYKKSHCFQYQKLPTTIKL